MNRCMLLRLFLPFLLLCEIEVSNYIEGLGRDRRESGGRRYLM